MTFLQRVSVACYNYAERCILWVRPSVCPSVTVQYHVKWLKLYDHAVFTGG